MPPGVSIYNFLRTDSVTDAVRVRHHTAGQALTLPPAHWLVSRRRPSSSSASVPSAPQSVKCCAQHSVVIGTVAASRSACHTGYSLHLHAGSPWLKHITAPLRAARHTSRLLRRTNLEGADTGLHPCGFECGCDLDMSSGLESQQCTASSCNGRQISAASLHPSSCPDHQ